MASHMGNETIIINENESLENRSQLNLPYTVCEILVAICAIFGNGLVIFVFSRDRKLRRRTNYYIISLAAADLLVGLFAIPFAILASIGLPTNLHACLFTVSLLVVLCTISIFCLVAVSIDRYWAILYPMGYSRTMRTKTAIGIICVCWVAGSLVGFLPLFGWNAGKKSDEKCIFTEVMDYNYLVFLYFATIIFPALLIAAFYAHIYQVIVKQLQQIVTMNPGRKKENEMAGTMLRLLGAAQKRDVKVTQNLSRIVIFFIICWFPLYTINCVMAFCPNCEVNEIFMKFCIILSHLNSVGNPLLYAYHLKDFRAALKSLISRLLFPQSEDKKTVVSVIHERGSFTGSQRNCLRNPNESLIIRTQRNRSLRQATDGKTETSSLMKKTRPCLSEIKATVSKISTSNSTLDDDQVELKILPRSDDLCLPINERNESIDLKVVESNVTCCDITCMEINTYDSLAPFVRVESNILRGTSTESIFITKVDVNRSDSYASGEKLAFQIDSSEGKDVSG